MDMYDKIDAILAEKKMSRRQLALAAGISENTLSGAFRRRTKNFSMDNVMKIANVLGVPFTDLISIEWADPEDRLFVGMAEKLPDNRIVMSDRHAGLCDVVKYKGYYLEQYNDGKFSMMTPEGSLYTISQDDVETVMDAVEKVALLQLQIIEQREHQATLQNTLKKNSTGQESR